jgi:16S rRNA (cytosine967-C5)-methyltransferase
VLEARRIAHSVLVRVEKGGAFANRALDAAIAEAGRLDPRDVALATELVYGTLRRQIFIDHALSHFSNQKLPDLEHETRALLRLGAHQLLHLRMPERAAVHETVELAKEIHNGRPVKYVNAVLRALARERRNILIPPESVDPVGYLSLTESFPRWMVESLIAWKGFDAAKALLASLNQQAPFTVRANVLQGQRDDVVHELKAELGLDALPTRYSPVGLTLEEAKASAALLRPAEGRWQAQDEAAQLIGFYASPKPGSTVLDACAAPGGKTCHLAELMQNRGVVHAIDVHTNKVREISDAAAKLGITIIEARPADATFPFPFAPADGYDLVLADVPCSAMGTIRRHPELKQRRTAEDIVRLAELQARILDNVAKYVKPGGVLVYSVCTFAREEGPAQVSAFLARHPEFVRVPPPEVSGVNWSDLLDSEGDLVVDPAHHGIDAFYAARLMRREEV